MREEKTSERTIKGFTNEKERSTGRILLVQNQNQNLYLLRLHNKHFANILHYDKHKNTHTYIYKRLTSDKIPTGYFSMYIARPSKGMMTITSNSSSSVGANMAE